MAGRYSSLGQYNEAIKYAENCLHLMKESKEIALEDRLPTLDSLVVYYSAIHNIDKINLYAKEAYLIRKNYNITDENMAKSLFYLLHSSYSLLKYEDCEVIVKELKELYGDSFSSNYKHYYDDMEILMQSFFKRRLYKEALEVSDEIRTTYMDQYGEDNEYLASIYFNQANIYTYLGETVKYHDYTIKALEIIRKSSGGGSPKYLSYLSTAANNFFNMGLFNEAYDLFKEASSLADNLYGKMHILYITNYLSAMTLWDRKMEEFYDDYNLEDLYRCLLFQRCVYGINNIKQERFERMMNSQYHFIKSSLPNLLYKYKDTLSINAIYNCLLLSKLKAENPEQIISQVSSELGKESNKRFLEYCKTNSAYTNAQFNSTPEFLDSLYREANHLITLFSKESITFRNFIKEMVTVDTLRNNLKDKELIIDYIPQKHLGTRYVDYLVFLDNKKLCPDFVPVTNAQEQIKQLIKSYSTIYYLIDNDSVLLNLNLDKNYNSIIGYKTSIAHILNRGRITSVH